MVSSLPRLESKKGYLVRILTVGLVGFLPCSSMNFGCRRSSPSPNSPSELRPPEGDDQANVPTQQSLANRSAKTHSEASAIPVVNTGRFVDQPLSDRQIEEILAEAKPLTPDGARVWFIAANRNQTRDNETHLAATIYFTPDRHSKRIRYGSCFAIDTGWEKHREILHQAFNTGAKLKPVKRALSTYCQISFADAPFDGSLNTPEGGLLPFYPPGEVSEAELVELVDFVRSAPRTTTRSDATTWQNRINPLAPIAFIKRTDEGFDIHTGSLEGPMSGMGQLIQCKKTEVGLELVSLGTWVS